MKGKLEKINDNWFVTDEYHNTKYPVYPVDIADIEANIADLNGTRIDYRYINEFNTPEFYRDVPLFEGLTYACVTGPLEIRCPHCDKFNNQHKSNCTIHNL